MAGQTKWEWQKHGGKNIRTRDLIAPIFLPAVFSLKEAGGGRGMGGRVFRSIPLPIFSETGDSDGMHCGGIAVGQKSWI
jgi:hypothetical protein